MLLFVVRAPSAYVCACVVFACMLCHASVRVCPLKCMLACVLCVCVTFVLEDTRQVMANAFGVVIVRKDIRRRRRRGHEIGGDSNRDSANVWRRYECLMNGTKTYFYRYKL
jgi:hypothetical protein